jgi:hypothetical protein
MLEATYPIAPRGLATSFTESELPIDFADRFKNRFINAAGGAEKRPGIVQLGAAIAGAPLLTGVHELVKRDGTAILFVSGHDTLSDSGAIWKYDDVGTFSRVHSGLSTNRLRSVQMNDRLIFVNGSDRNFYTTDGTAFRELEAIVEMGTTGTGTSAGSLVDAEVLNWITGTDVVINDIVFYVESSAYGLITAVASAALTHTRVSATSPGAGDGAEPTANQRYRIIDLVELNIVPQPDGEQDNVAVATGATNASVIAVSGVSFSATEIRAGDFVSNTTRSAVTKVLSVSANIRVKDVAGQTSGDSLVFLKSAMPVSDFAHVHYGRLYLTDLRDKTKVRISGANDPTDYTTDAGTLDSVSFNFGGQQPRGDSIVTMASFQQYLALGGKQNIYLFSGTTPIRSSAAATDYDFQAIGLFPQGVVSPSGMVGIGNDITYVGRDGVQSISQVDDASTLNRANLTEALRKTVREEIDTSPQDLIQLVHYPQRSWLLFKVNDRLYCYNYAAFFGETNQQAGDNWAGGSWSLFEGKFANQQAYLVRLDGTLICVGPFGKVYEFDGGVFSDDGDPIATEYRTGWLTLDEPKKTVRIKKLSYIKPLIESGANTEYQFIAQGSYESEGLDMITVNASGNSAPLGLFTVGQNQIGVGKPSNVKYPLRARGEAIRLTITTEDTQGPDTLSRFTLYASVHGRQ